jgi:acetoin utilization deacetylase AcuC-like enzyme
LRVHTKAYLDEFKRLSDVGFGSLGRSAPVGPGTFEIAKVSAGLAMGAVDLVLNGEMKNAYSLSRPPGHHCLPDAAMGFCYLANIAVAIEAAIAKHGPMKIAVLDWDVHHGNGTQKIYESRSDVLTISIHQDACFPPGYSGENDRGVGAGVGTNINVPLPPGSGHNTYLHAMRRIVAPAIEAFRPDLIIVACGYDANAVDPLARMLLHSDSFREMTRIVRDLSEKLCAGRLVMVHEGGYAESYVPFCGLAVIEELSEVRTEVNDPMLTIIHQQQPSLAV